MAGQILGSVMNELAESRGRAYLLCCLGPIESVPSSLMLDVFDGGSGPVFCRLLQTGWQWAEGR